MRPRVFLSRPFSPHFPPLSSHSAAAAAAAARRPPHPPETPVHSDLTSHLLPLFRNLSKNPNNPKTLSFIDSILPQSHLLDSTTCVSILRTLAHSNNLTRFKTLLSSLKQRGKIPTLFLYSTLLQSLLPQNPIHDVERVWIELFAQPTAAITDQFAFYVSLHCDDALDVDPLCRRILSNQWKLSCNACRAMIGALCLKKNSNPGLARELLRGMVERDLEVDVFSCYTVFRSFCRIGDLFGADSVLRDVVSVGDFGLDFLVCGDFLGCLCKAGKFREARKLFDKMSRRNNKRNSSIIKPGRRAIFQLSFSNKICETMAFEAYFGSLCSYGRLEEAEILLKEAMSKCLVPGVCVMKSFVNALFSAGRHEEAIRLFNAGRKRGDAAVGDLADAVIGNLCSIDRVDEGYELAGELVNEGYVLTAWVWNMIMKRYWEGGRAEKAMAIFEGIKLGTLCSFLRPDKCTYVIMIHGLVGVGMVDEAISVFEEMGRTKFAASVDLYGIIVRNLHLCGRSKEVQGYLNRMIENGIFVSYAQWEVLFDSLTSINKNDVFPGTYQEDSERNKIDMEILRGNENGF